MPEEHTVHTAAELKYLQSLPLDRKIAMTEQRIADWYKYWHKLDIVNLKTDKHRYVIIDTRDNRTVPVLKPDEWIEAEYDGAVCLSFSGGKDSTVLKHIIDNMGLEIPAVFANTGLEYASIQKFARENGAKFVYPKKNFAQVITEYGYPIISKEVAEAIYYARRIRSQSVQVERERERERERENVRNCSDELETALPARNSIESRPTPPHNEWKRRRLLGQDRVSRAGVNGSTGEGGVFSNPVSQFGDRSLFNKEKWLPACQELPFLISHMCCNTMKKSPMHKYQRAEKRVPILGTTAEESRVRKQAWIRHGCNAFDSANPTSQPMSFWTEQDVLHYIKKYNLKIAEPYGEVVYTDDDGNDCLEALDSNAKLHCTGCARTGCVYCMFGAHAKDDNRFIELQKIAPRQFEYAFEGGQWSDNPYYVPDAEEYDGDWKNWNPQKIWTPSKEGLGLRFVIDSFNELYPKNKIKY